MTSTDEGGPQPTGRGYACGCRDPDRDYRPDLLEIFTTIAAALLLNVLGIAGAAFLRWVREQLLRTLPAWVSVEREGVPRARWPSMVEHEREVEGVLVRSFQTWTDVPVYQWHRWYDWNFHVVPAAGYKYLRGRGNLEARVTGDEVPATVGKTIECEWDCGVFGAYDFDQPAGRRPSLGEPGPMFGDHRDWAWPMAGQHIWISGRWIYDCGHAHEGRMKTELHPCKAIATARWEAVRFEEHEHYVPALQFVFFACRKGGYFDYPMIHDRDYEFIVDLPPLPSATVEYAVGRTSDFPMNTLRVRPRFLVKTDHSHFSNAYGNRAQPGQATPEVELLPPPADGGTPSQVKVRIPLTRLADRNVDSYGVVVSLGWHDPREEQKDSVKRVVVTFLSIERFETHEAGEGEWQIKFGVNGRWRAKYQGELLSETRLIRLGKTVTLHLALEDLICVNCHGMEEEKVGDVMHESKSDRTLKDSDSQPYTWFGDIDQSDNSHASGVAEAMLRKLAKTFEDQNEPLGIIDAGYPTQDASDTVNPVSVETLMELAGGPGRVVPCKQTATFTKVRKSDEQLVYERNRKDYVLHYTLEYHDQTEHTA
jgi:hypothetical protein